MGYKVKIQKIERATNKTYYVNFPGAFADAIDLEKGEDGYSFGTLQLTCLLAII